MHLTIAILVLLAGLKWGDWKNWPLYYSTVLYMIVFNLLFNVLTYNYPIWMYERSILPNHTLIDILNTFILFPATIFIYLPRFPEGNRMKKILYIFKWVAMYGMGEYFLKKLGYFSYYNGWNVFWSLGFNVIMFSMLRLHFKKPLLAMGVSIFIVLFSCCFFMCPLIK